MDKADLGGVEHAKSTGRRPTRAPSRPGFRLPFFSLRPSGRAGGAEMAESTRRKSYR